MLPFALGFSSEPDIFRFARKVKSARLFFILMGLTVFTSTSRSIKFCSEYISELGKYFQYFI